MLAVRQARISDHRAMVECVQKWWGDSRTPDQAQTLSLLLPKLFLRFFSSTSLVLEDSTGMRAFLVGFYAADNEHEAYIHFVGVDPKLRRQGIARSLYTTFFQRAAEAGRSEVRAITSPGNTGSIAFHRAMGFALEEGNRTAASLSVHKDYDGPGQDRVCFYRSITSTDEPPTPRHQTRRPIMSRALGDDAELIPLEPWQAAEFAAYTDRVRDALNPWMPWAYAVVDEASARAFLQNYADRQASDTGRIFGLYVSGVMQGGLLYRTFNTAQRVCEIGVWLAPEVRGRGLITRASRVLIDWAINVRGMARVEWRCNPCNGPSVATARRLGFTHEGTHRNAYHLNGEQRDVQVWAIIA